MMEGVSAGRAGSSIIRREAVPQASLAEKSAGKARKAGTMGVTWQACEGGSCKCAGRRRTVIRYQREHNPYSTQTNTLTNWYRRSAARPYVNTTIAEFNEGFNASIANRLPACGGDVAWSK